MPFFGDLLDHSSSAFHACSHFIDFNENAIKNLVRTDKKNEKEREKDRERERVH